MAMPGASHRLIKWLIFQSNFFRAAGVASASDLLRNA